MKDFFIKNADIFGKYFEDGDYLQLVNSNLTKVKEIIREKSQFNFQDWIKNLK